MSQPLRVLFVGETGVDALALELREGGYEPSFEEVSSQEQLQQALNAKWDIAISDFTVGDCGALAALKAIQERGADLPLIVVSGKIKDCDVLAALKAGAAVLDLAGDDNQRQI